MSYTDKVLQCRECGVEFVWSAGEQEFYASRAADERARPLPGLPLCPPCPAVRGRAPGSSSMGDMGSRPRREMHPAVCAECGADTMVPFLPRNDKPVYCSTCFDKVRARQ